MNPGVDPCASVRCAPVDCPVETYVPRGECCPVCPVQVTPPEETYGYERREESYYEQPESEQPQEVDVQGSPGDRGPPGRTGEPGRSG